MEFKCGVPDAGEFDFNHGVSWTLYYSLFLPLMFLCQVKTISAESKFLLHVCHGIAYIFPKTLVH